MGHRHIRFPLEQLVEALQKDTPASETGESLTKTLSERKNGLVETGEAGTLRYRSVFSLVKERRALVVEFQNGK